MKVTIVYSIEEYHKDKKIGMLWSFLRSFLSDCKFSIHGIGDRYTMLRWASTGPKDQKEREG